MNKQLRPGLGIALAAAVALSAWLLFSSPAPTVVAVVAPDAAARHMPILTERAAPPSTPARLPDQLPSYSWDLAEHDPFQGPPLVAAAPATPKPMAMSNTLATAPPPAPVQPPPPVLAYTFLGRLRSPTGDRLVLLSDGLDSVVAADGVALGNGYTVERVTADAVWVLHAELVGLRQHITLPAASDSE
jgi:hypothetical protein